VIDGHYFVSYSRADAADFAVNLADQLRAGRPTYNLWVDVREIQPWRRDWDEQISEAIQTCMAVLFVMTPDSVRIGSECKNEWAWALRYKKPIIPLQLHPDADPPYRLASRQYVDFTDRDTGLARLRLFLVDMRSPAGVLRESNYRLADAERDLYRTPDMHHRRRIEQDVRELRRHIQEQERVLQHPHAAGWQTQEQVADVDIERPDRPQPSLDALEAAQANRRDFLISYVSDHRSWAEWIAVELEAAGYSTVLQARDGRAANDIHWAFSEAGRTVVVLSPADFGSELGEAEWRVAFTKVLAERPASLIPVRVEPMGPSGLISSQVSVDLVDADEAEARRLLLEAVNRALVRRTRAIFPGNISIRRRGPEPFPGLEPGVRVGETPGRSAPERVRVFISYAHDSPVHDDAVRDLWVFLRSNGFDARLDLPAAERQSDWPVWMHHEVRDADFVLVIASPAYKRRAEGAAGVDEGRGVQWEAALIREEFYTDRDKGLAKFVPVVLPGQSGALGIPAWLGPVSSSYYTVSGFTVAGAEQLLRYLSGQPFELEPSIGTVPVLAPRSTGPESVVLSTQDIPPHSLDKITEKPPPWQPVSPSNGVFVCYRREDTSHLAGRLGDRLNERFGQVFMDIDTLEPGMDFTNVIRLAINECDVLLALIGPRWVTATDMNGRRCLDNPNDFVVHEIRAALEQDIAVIPVLVDGAQMPTLQELPTALTLLAKRQAVSVQLETFRADAARLGTIIENLRNR
jgi:hypothetical protein